MKFRVYTLSYFLLDVIKYGGIKNRLGVCDYEGEMSHQTRQHKSK
jgi:hypothetical protein